MVVSLSNDAQSVIGDARNGCAVRDVLHRREGVAAGSAAARRIMTRREVAARLLLRRMRCLPIRRQLDGAS
jgi:hypothetical protein